MATARRKWTRRKVLTLLEELKKSGQSLKASDVMKYNSPLYLASRKYVGSWRAVMKGMGVDYTKINSRKPQYFWNKERIISKIMERKKLGLDLHSITVKKEERGLYFAAFNHFGRNGWLKALSLAGLDPKRETKIGFTKEEVIAAIRILYSRFFSIRHEHVKYNGYRALVESATYLFRSWKNAVEAAGFDYEEVVGHKIWNRQKMIEEIHRLNSEGASLNPTFIYLHRKDLFASAIPYFGSWSQALDAAGIDYQLHYKTWSSKAWLRKLDKKEVQRVIEQGRKQSQKRRANQ